jgi:glycosyltransferase involved in cell wall biosynthesis
MEKITFTIVITTHNRLLLLKEAIQSALRQTIPCEIIISDDASDDGTQEYIASLGDQVIYHRNSIPKGQSSVVNAGVKMATGEWIKLLDDDDLLEENCIDMFSKAISQHPDVVLCSCQAMLITQDKKTLGRTFPNGTTQLCYVKQEDVHYGMFTENLPLGATTQVAFKKVYFNKIDGWDFKFDRYGNDIICWVEIAQYGDVMFINQSLVSRLIWEGSYSKLTFQEYLDKHKKIKEKILPYIHEKYSNQLPELSTIFDFLQLYWGFIALSNKSLQEGGRIIFKSLFSLKGWQYFLRFIWRRKLKKKGYSVFIMLNQH